MEPMKIRLQEVMSPDCPYSQEMDSILGDALKTCLQTNK